MPGANHGGKTSHDTGPSHDRGEPVRLRVRLLALVAACSVVVPACAGHQYQFVADHRVHISAPRQRSTVTLPVTVRWSFDGFRVTGPDARDDPQARSFAVFVDRTPVPAGKALRWLARN